MVRFVSVLIHFFIALIYSFIGEIVPEPTTKIKTNNAPCYRTTLNLKGKHYTHFSAYRSRQKRI